MSDGSPVFMTPGEDPEMEAASQQARESFRYFWREMAWEYRRIVPALGVAAVKIAFADEVAAGQFGPPEHMWLNEVQFDGASLAATLLNAPNWVRSVQAGQRVSLPLDRVGDWMYSRGGRCYGAFTVNLMRSRMGAAERADHDDAWGMDFGDPSDVQVVPDWSAEPTPAKKRGLFGKKKAAATQAPTAQDLTAEHPMALNMAEAYGQQLRDNAEGILGYRDERGFMPLHDMALAGATTAVRLMLSHGADPRALTGHGWSAAQLAYSLGWHDTVALLQQHGG